jgi:hypothetical protein
MFHPKCDAVHNDAEWQMVAQLGQRSRLIALSDPKLRIYDFKGADPALRRIY